MSQKKLIARCFYFRVSFYLVAFLPSIVSAQDQPAAEVRYDTVLIGGTIHRGDGNDPIIGHIAIRDGKIAEISTTTQPDGAIRIDCTGLVVAPGFIDLHNHSDDPILKRDTRGNVNYLL